MYKKAEIILPGKLELYEILSKFRKCEIFYIKSLKDELFGLKNLKQELLKLYKKFKTSITDDMLKLQTEEIKSNFNMLNIFRVIMEEKQVF